MKYTNIDMFYILADTVGLGEETMDILIKVMGNTPDTYKKILTKLTPYKTFEDLERAYYIPFEDEERDDHSRT